MSNPTIHWQQAIKEMRALSSLGRPFSFSFYTWDRDKKTSHGLRSFKRATLRATPQEYIVSNAKHKLFFTDLDEQRELNCWQILLASYNGKTIIV